MRRFWTVPFVLVSLLACDDFALGPDPATTNAAVFDRLWREFDRHYALFGIKGHDWDEARERFRPSALEADNPRRLATILWSMLEELSDNHVSLSTPFRSFSHDSGIATPHGERITWSRAFGDVGYIRIAEFSGSTDRIGKALASLGDLDGLVVDVRSNSGGLIRNADAVAGHFVDRGETYAFTRYRNGPDHSDFGDPVALRVRPVRRAYRGNVVVLTDRRTFSAAETFALAMRTNERTVIVGDTTGGSVGKPVSRELPNGWLVKVSQWIAYDTDGSVIEDVGVAPDVFVSDGDGPGDRPLEEALAILRAASRAPSPFAP